MIAHGVPGIDIQQSHVFRAAAVVVFAALTSDIDAWWPASQRLTGPSAHLSLAPTLGAELVETGPAGAGSAIWGRIDLIVPLSRLYLNGWFGVPGVVMGRVHYDLYPEAGTTRLVLTHQAIGPVSEDRVSRQRSLWREALGGSLARHLSGIPA